MVAPHPLFPLDSDEDEPPDVSVIRVFRMTTRGKVCHPMAFRPHELPDEQALYELTGGGIYQVQARNETNSRITATRTFEFPGQPKPWAGEDTGPAPAAPQPSSSGGLDANAILLAVMQAMQSSNQAMLTMAQASSQQTIALVTGMLQSSKQDAQAMVQAMAALSQASSKQQGELFKAMIEAGKGGGSGELEAFVAGMQAHGEMTSGGDDDISIKDMMAMGMSFMQGRQAAQAQNPSPAKPPLPPPPGQSGAGSSSSAAASSNVTPIKPPGPPPGGKHP